MIFSHVERDAGGRTELWLVELPHPPTPMTLKECCVPDNQCTAAGWIPFAADADSARAAERGCRLAKACPGAVFIGIDRRGFGGCGNVCYGWQALPGPHVPSGTHGIALAQQRPTFDDGVRYPSTKVIVWATRECDPNGTWIPLGYHVEAGVFDDSDLAGQAVRGWLPLTLAPILQPARARGP